MRFLDWPMVISDKPKQNKWNSKNSKGYHWHKPNKKYVAQIRLNGELIHLGYFYTAEEARNAYLKAKKIYHKIEGE